MSLTRLWWYLILVAALSAFCYFTLHVRLLAAVVLRLIADRQEKRAAS